MIYNECVQWSSICSCSSLKDALTSFTAFVSHIACIQSHSRSPLSIASRLTFYMLKDAAINGGCNQIMVAAVYDMLVIVLVILGALIGFLTLMNGRWRPFRVSFRVRDTKRPALGIILVNAKNLSFELKRVTNWALLGINLGVPVYELTKITKDYKGRSDQQRLQMLNLWLQCTPTASWGEVVHALELMGERREAERIQRKYANRERKG